MKPPFAPLDMQSVKLQPTITTLKALAQPACFAVPIFYLRSNELYLVISCDSAGLDYIVAKHAGCLRAFKIFSAKLLASEKCFVR